MSINLETSPPESRRLFVAMDRVTGRHSLIGVYRKEQLGPRRGVLDRDVLNGLIAWDSLEAPSKLTPLTGPLVPVKSVGGDDCRVMGIAEVVSATRESLEGGPKGRFAFCKGAALLEELYLNGGKRPFPSKARVAKDVERMGLLEADGLAELERLGESEADGVVIAESVGDWALMRNLCAVLLRVIAHLKAGEANAKSTDKANAVNSETIKTDEISSRG